MRLDAKATLAAAGGWIFLFLTTGVGWAQSYPAKPIRLLIGFSPGGGADVVARSLSPQLVETLGQQIVVENRPGANGIIAAELAAKAPPDGYTLLVAPGNYAFAPAMNAKLPFDMATAFAPVSQLAETPLLVVVHPSLPVKNMQQLIVLAKSYPKKLSYASGGIGGSGHLAVELFSTMTQVQAVHVPYKGTGAAITDLIGGQVPLCFCTLPSVFPHVKSGRLRALAVTTARRTPAAPDIPTVAEAGVPGYEMSQWYGLLAPAGTPTPIIERLNSEIGKALKHPELRSRLQSEGAEAVGSSPQEFGAFFKAEIVKWTRIVQSTGMRAD
ncbi:MAG: tripartite tricarboxylate transporter substrate binding protein [Candidatus Rokubacteria bacterium]|nr:tripartite tricarboxylate transporter substrate binding protein [Candidatus Rokubacteria bacterium]